MIKRSKIWKTLGAAALAGTASVALLAGCEKPATPAPSAEQTPAAPAETAAVPMDHDAMTDPAAVVAGSGEGEGTAGKSVDITTDNVAYLAQLSYVKGHLLAGTQLYDQGAADMGNVHMKHPKDELIASLVPAIQARGAPSFDTELTALADKVHGNAPKAEVDAAFTNLISAIDKTEQVGTGNALTDPKQVILMVQEIVRTAASEYALAVKDGNVVNPKEYQDAYGFVQIAKQRVAAVTGATGPAADALAAVKAQLDLLDPAWPSIVPPATVTTDASMLYGAAARIEIAGLGL